MGSLTRVCSGSTQGPKKLPDRGMHVFVPKAGFLANFSRVSWYLAYDVRNTSTTFTES